ncbi:MAG: outer membrane protein assembly factor BamA [Planctomycetota bacterium]
MTPARQRQTGRPRQARARAASLAASLAAGLIVGSAASPTLAQTGGVAPEARDDFGPLSDRPDLAEFEGRLIRRVQIRGITPAIARRPERIGPLDPAEEQLVRNTLRAVEGAPYRQETITSDIATLNRLGRFARVNSRVQLLDDGSVVLLYDLVSQPLVEDVQVVGNNQISDQDLRDVIQIITGTPVDRLQIDRAARAIEDLYRERGYYLARVLVAEEELIETGTVLFRIREGVRLRVTDIRFEGANDFPARQLRPEVKTKEAWLLNRGELDEDVLADDVAALIAFYRDRGYLDVRIDRQVTPSPDNTEAIVTFIIEEGPLYTVRDIRVEYTNIGDEPAEPFSPEQIRGVMFIKTGDVYSARAVRRSVDAVTQAHGELGFPDVRVRSVFFRDEQRPAVDLIMRVSTGSRAKAGLVEVIGNEFTKGKVIRRNVRILPERPLNSADLRDAQTRIEGSGLFARGSVRVQALETEDDEPGYRDILVEVEETNTGSFNIGAAIDSDAGLAGLVSLSQRNFDIADVPDTPGELFSGRAFRGAGQNFSINASPGTQVQLFSIGLTEPRLFESDYSFSARAFYRDRDFDEFDEIRFGGSLGVGRRFGDRWTGNLSFRFESIDLQDIEPDRPTDVFLFEDQNTLTGAGFALTRSTLDSRLIPTRGARIALSAEQVGAFGGDFDFTKLSASHDLYVPIYEDYLGRKFVLSFSTRASYIPQDRDEVPVYERYYLGGRNFRGFDFRTISPKGIRNDTGEPSDDPVGGTWLFFHGIQLSVPLIQEAIRFVGFVDTGTVTFDPGFEDYRVSAGVGIRVLVPQLSPAPLAFDFGFPVVSQDGDESRLFSFSIDLPF